MRLMLHIWDDRWYCDEVIALKMVKKGIPLGVEVRGQRHKPIHGTCLNWQKRELYI